ncbi:Endothelin-2 [Oryzias melastigma]|uniref:Endothelin-2 n=1 Tax=Oryzias melastigma TaxID=30732 RepID=A0A834FX34_ORYME|nr:endothelin-2 [Oryzias melastigma]KAF6739892.1 Endothelin-2 [Oryzias melastigma]
MSTHSSLFLLVTLWASFQDGLGLPVMKESDVDVGDGAPTHHVRTRRCACSTQDDYECHYFCHLDIIWVNTPSKTTVYGLGGALLRRRRSTGRCTCADVRDEACSNFCRVRPDIKSVKRSHLDILSILRSAAVKSNRAGVAPGSDGEQLSESEIA